MGLLSVAIWLPIAGARCCWRWAATSNARHRALDVRCSARWPAAGHDAADHRLRHHDRGHAVRREGLPWIERFNVRYHLGVDGISVWFVLLTAFITVVVVIAGWEVITDRVASTWAPS
jgi:NADH-quinone oxidoreductase subunit M